ncbi:MULTISPECIES: hypothetical protein [Streptomyces]|uniref:Uncharacterized protein n=1 Tax=Streptomyces venezuelae (strain ATCC 10712 / CBS 650.69 / DSM 40230 / JCM 4526 / NBRC 13096 / PD 04745) TaxID=953739 RepID=F2R580_STRVP|nr:hypothetical protein [Streptomyces venezuelae]APE24087.1 hypothetical protein vnz_25690 [Streptomyces venezuelae]QES01458.1 hypothetical protein DEJ43_26085 [Streptomyces venezuelae ATCC 10712]CCA58484.1 hypothetical protein SVEN_5198 [Streptomyces venezuelae ATCC 10712]
MPGSTTIRPGHGVDPIEHADALRLTSLMKELHRLLTEEGPDRLTDAQIAALRAGDGLHREGLTDWVERIARDLERATA